MSDSEGTSDDLPRAVDDLPGPTATTVAIASTDVPAKLGGKVDSAFLLRMAHEMGYGDAITADKLPVYYTCDRCYHSFSDESKWTTHMEAAAKRRCRKSKMDLSRSIAAMRLYLFFTPDNGKP
jgi:uncharacterized protein YmfQ (DUF2313 family)